MPGQVVTITAILFIMVFFLLKGQHVISMFLYNFNYIFSNTTAYHTIAAPFRQNFSSENN